MGPRAGWWADVEEGWRLWPLKERKEGRLQEEKDKRGDAARAANAIEFLVFVGLLIEIE